MNQKTGLAVIIMITLGIATVATGAILRQSTEARCRYLHAIEKHHLLSQEITSTWRGGLTKQGMTKLCLEHLLMQEKHLEIR